MASKLAQQAADSELMSPPSTAASGASAATREDVLKTLGIKCHQNLSTINLALAHLRGEYLECKTGDVGKSTLSTAGKEVFAPRTPNKQKLVSPKNIKKEVPSSLNKRKKRSKYF